MNDAIHLIALSVPSMNEVDSDTVLALLPILRDVQSRLSTEESYSYTN